MESTQSYTLPVSPQRAWEALTDAQVLRASIPGCESIQPEGDATFAFAAGPSLDGAAAPFSGHLRVVDANPPAACTVRFESKAGSESAAVGSIRLQFNADGDAATTLAYDADVEANGQAGTVGLFAEAFVKRFAAHVAGERIDVPAEAPQPPEPSLQHAAVAESAPAGKGAKCWKA
ncbi:MAG TPA: SRPBCC domain-containing protein, partial [Trinickia sp.]|uniref:CoxG family protein n=1 Tax=Trinickia sp. TaxID=2571163 RepID=UPI002C182C9B